MPRLQLPAHVFQHRRHLQRRDDLIEEPLMRAPELGQGRALGVAVAGLAGCLQGFARLRQHALPGQRQFVVDVGLQRCQVMIQPPIGHPVERQRTSDIHAQRLHVPRHQFHRRHAARIDLVDELGRVAEIGALAPQPQPRRITQVAHLGRARG